MSDLIQKNKQKDDEWILVEKEEQEDGYMLNMYAFSEKDIPDIEKEKDAPEEERDYEQEYEEYTEEMKQEDANDIKEIGKLTARGLFRGKNLKNPKARGVSKYRTVRDAILENVSIKKIYGKT